jgi:hypothetical protein
MSHGGVFQAHGKAQARAIGFNGKAQAAAAKPQGGSCKGEERKLKSKREHKPFAAMAKHEGNARAATAKLQGQRMQANG